MRCELCNRSVTYAYIDGAGGLHEYCQYCIEEIEDTLDSYEEADNEWWPEDFTEDNIQEDQGVGDTEDEGTNLG